MATTKIEPKLHENVGKKAKNYQGLTGAQLIDAYRIMVEEGILKAIGAAVKAAKGGSG